MTYWIFNLKGCKSKEKKTEKLLNFRLQNNVWFLNPNNRYISNIIYGDEVIVYEVRKKRFVAKFTIASTPYEMRKFEKQRLMFYECKENQDFLVVRIKDIVKFEKPLHIKEVYSNLCFIKNKSRWGSYLSRGVTRIWNNDFHLILKKLNELNRVL